MAKSRKGRGGQLPFAAGSPRFGAPGRTTNPADLIPRAKPADDLETFLAKANSKAGPPGVPGFSPGSPTSRQIWSAKALEANRYACEGARLINEGRPAEAIPLLTRAIQVDPGVAASYHDLGVALMSAARLEQAAEAFAAAVRLDPGMATAHHFLGCIFDNQSLEAKAIAAYRAAIALKPDLAAAQLRLGELYLMRGLRGESVAAFRAAAAAAKGSAWGRVAEARALDASGASNEALAAMRAAVEADPDGVEARVFLGKLLAEAGLTAEAAAQYECAAERLPEMGAAWTGIALIKKFTADDDPLIERMNAVLARPHLAPRDRQAIHFALGKAHDDTGEYEAAMRNFEAGNHLRARGGHFDRDALVRRVDQLIEATPPGYRDRQADPGVEDATPVLIVGMPRSGSTLTEQILSSHPEVSAGGELEFWRVRDTPRQDALNLAATAEGARRLAEDYLATLRALGPGAKRITDKALNNFMLLGVLHRVFPNATLIHCRRHPIDTALSIFTTNFETNLGYGSDRSDLVFYIRQYQRLMAHWREVLPPNWFLEVDYEALVADPEPHARRLIAVCGLEWNDACLAPHRNTRKITTASIWQARQPMYRTSVERWRRYEPWLGELRGLASEAYALHSLLSRHDRDMTKS